MSQHLYDESGNYKGEILSDSEHQKRKSSGGYINPFGCFSLWVFLAFILLILDGIFYFFSGKEIFNLDVFPMSFWKFIINVVFAFFLSVWFLNLYFKEKKRRNS